VIRCDEYFVLFYIGTGRAVTYCHAARWPSLACIAVSCVNW